MPQVFDTPTTETAAPVAERPDAGGTNESQDSADNQNDNAVLEPTDSAGADGGAEAGQAGEDDNGQAGEAAPAEGDTEPGVEGPAPFDPASFEQNLLQRIEEKLAGNQAAPARPQLTDEQWAQKEEEFGMNRRAIEKTIGMVSTVYDKIMAHMEERFAAIEKEPAIASLAKKPGFADATRYKPGMDEYLSRFSPKLHNNPELLEQAYFYAKGKAAASNIQRVRKAGEIQRRIAGPARPAAPSAGARQPAAPQLTRIEKDTAARFGMSEADYAKYKVNGKSVLVS